MINTKSIVGYYKPGTIDCWTVFPYAYSKDLETRGNYIGCSIDGAGVSQWGHIGRYRRGRCLGKFYRFKDFPESLQRHILVGLVD